jgi:phosphate uptake regulator
VNGPNNIQENKSSEQEMSILLVEDDDTMREVLALNLDKEGVMLSRELLTLIMSNLKNIDQATYLTWAAHNLERTGDRVLNICERVIFMVTGDMIELNREG